MALISVSPPGKHGYCSLGTSVDITRSAIQNAERIIGILQKLRPYQSIILGQVNPNVPETGGDANIHSSHFDYLVYGTQPLHEMEQVEPNLDEIKVGRIISEELVEDGCTIEAGKQSNC